MKLRENREKLIELLPDFLKEITEISLIQQIGDDKLDEINEDGGAVLSSAFIEDASEEDIEHYELMLKMTSEGLSIESRRKRLLMKFRKTGPITYIYIRKSFDILCGKGNYTISPDDYHNMIGFVTHLFGFGELRQVEDFLETGLPASVYYTIDNTVSADANKTFSFAGAAFENEVIDNTENYDFVVSQSKAFSASGEVYESTSVSISDSKS